MRPGWCGSCCRVRAWFASRHRWAAWRFRSSPRVPEVPAAEISEHFRKLIRCHARVADAQLFLEVSAAGEEVADAVERFRVATWSAEDVGTVSPFRSL